MNMSRPGSQMSQMGHHPKSASSIPRLPPLSRAVSLATGMSQMSDPREEKLNELERVIASYQEKLDAVTTNYQEKVSILERKLVDKDMTNGIGGDVSDGEVDRDDDGFSPQPTNVHFNGSDGGYLEIPPEGMSAPPPTNKMSLPGSPQKKMIQPIIEEESNAQEGEVESNNSAER